MSAIRIQFSHKKFCCCCNFDVVLSLGIVQGIVGMPPCCHPFRNRNVSLIWEEVNSETFAGDLLFTLLLIFNFFIFNNVSSTFQSIFCRID